MKKVALGIIVTLLILLPPALHAQTLGGRGFNKGGSGKSGFRGIVGKSKISGFRGGSGNGFVTYNSLGTRSRTKNSTGFARSNFNKRGVRSGFSNRPNSAFFNNTASITRNRPSINNGISSRRLPGIRLPKGLVVKSVNSEPKGLGTNLSAGANNFRSNFLRNRIIAKENRKVTSRDDIISSIKGIRINRFKGGNNNSLFKSKELNSNGLNNNLIANNRDVGRGMLQRATTSMNGVVPKKEIGLTQSNLSTTHSRKEEVIHSVDDGVLHFTNRVNSDPREDGTIKIMGSKNRSFQISRRLNINRTHTNSLSRASRDHLRLSSKRNFNSINSDNGFVVHNNNHHHHHVSNDNDFVFSFNFFFGNPFFFPQPIFFPAFFNPFVFNPLVPTPLFPITPLLPSPVLSSVIFQPVIVSPVFIPFPFSTVFFIDAFAVNDVIID